MSRELRDFAESILRQNERLLADVATLTTERDAAMGKLAQLRKQICRFNSFEPKQDLLDVIDGAAPVSVGEVDGFLVGDLVLAPGCGGRISRVVGVEAGIKLSTHERYHNADPSKLVRKPVAIGDMVRCISGPFKGRTGRVVWHCDRGAVPCMSVCTGPGEGSFWTEPSHLVAVSS